MEFHAPRAKSKYHFSGVTRFQVKGYLVCPRKPPRKGVGMVARHWKWEGWVAMHPGHGETLAHGFITREEAATWLDENGPFRVEPGHLV